MASSDESDNECENGPHPIHDAVVNGDCDRILTLLDEGYNIDDLNHRHETPVHLAVLHKQYNVLKLLLDHNALVFIEGCSNPLLFATTKEDDECIEILLDYKSDPSYQDEFTENLWTPIHEASNRGLTWILEQFLQTDCDLDVRTEDGATPTYVSCQYGQTECLQLLLDHGANAEIRVDTGETPLHIACQEGHYECVVTLLNHGVDIDSCNETNRTPLAASCFHDQYECAKLLIENHASLSTDTLDADSSPIHLAARHPGVQCLGLLIESGANVNTVCLNSTPLYEAVFADNLSGCRMLLSNGADPCCVCENNFLAKTPLMAAACNDNVDIIKELVSYGADVNQTTVTSPLMLAAKYQSFAALEQLLKYNVDLNFADKARNTTLSTLCGLLLLHCSTTNEYDRIFQCCRDVLRAGADLTHLIHLTKVEKTSLILEKMVIGMCPALVQLLLEFATCREHLQFLSRVSEMCADQGFEGWEQLCGVIWQPKTLSHMCRITIRSVLGEKRLGQIESLPLPRTLKDYLRHIDVTTFD